MAVRTLSDHVLSHLNRRVQSGLLGKVRFRTAPAESARRVLQQGLCTHEILFWNLTGNFDYFATAADSRLPASR